MEKFGFQYSQQGEKYKKIDKYAVCLQEILGKGTYGIVFLGIDLKSKNQVAIKQIDLSIIKQTQNTTKALQALQDEVKNMRQLDHPNIVKLINVKKSQNNLYLIMEYCNDGSLEKYLPQSSNYIPLQSETEIIRLLNEILNGFQYMHQFKIVHRDLKPANILLHNGQCKIADFGFSKQLKEIEMEDKEIFTQVGSPLYMSPQQLKGENYSSKTDIWSLGIIFYQIIYGRPPWLGKSPYNLFENILSKPLQFHQSPEILPEFKKLLIDMLQIDEDNRISWQQLFKQSQELQKVKEEIQEANLEKSLTILKSNKKENINEIATLNLIYFEKNRVLQNVDDLQQKLERSKGYVQKDAILDEQKIQKINKSSMLKNEIQKEVISLDSNIIDLDALNQKAKIEKTVEKEVIKIKSYLLHKRNKAVFFILLSIKLNQILIPGSDNQIAYCFIYFFAKRAHQILQKLLRVLNNLEVEVDKKFQKQSWIEFDKGQDKLLILKYIYQDNNIFYKLYQQMMEEKTAKFQSFNSQQQKIVQKVLNFINTDNMDKKQQNELFLQLCQQLLNFFCNSKFSFADKEYQKQLIQILESLCKNEKRLSWNPNKDIFI